MEQLTDLLPASAVDLDVDADDWRSAIRAAGELLERNGAIEPDYNRAMVEAVEEHGPYIVVAPGVAFAHARPSDAVHRTALSWVRLREPVEFGHATNDPVRTVIGLSATDAGAHTQALRELATVLSSSERRRALDDATTPVELLALLSGDSNDDAAPAGAVSGGAESTGPASSTAGGAGAASSTRNHILTVCGNGVGTSLFLKNTLEQVLDHWGWGSYLTVEATDTISARGKAKEADLILTSGEIARTLGDVGVPVKVVRDFTSTREIDAVLRDSYDI